jgi:hypothetical protein
LRRTKRQRVSYISYEVFLTFDFEIEEKKDGNRVFGQSWILGSPIRRKFMSNHLHDSDILNDRPGFKNLDQKIREYVKDVFPTEILSEFNTYRVNGSHYFRDFANGNI